FANISLRFSEVRIYGWALVSTYLNNSKKYCEIDSVGQPFVSDKNNKILVRNLRSINNVICRK
ncbi:hypothetical protein ACFL2V_20040, partial [Pseudomonadota bacterium]